MMTSPLLALLLAPFRTGFTRPTWKKVRLLVEGTLLARGRRTVTSALRMMGLQQEARCNVFHHVPPPSTVVPLADEPRALLSFGTHLRPGRRAGPVGR